MLMNSIISFLLTFHQYWVIKLRPNRIWYVWLLTQFRQRWWHSLPNFGRSCLPSIPSARHVYSFMTSIITLLADTGNALLRSMFAPRPSCWNWALALAWLWLVWCDPWKWAGEASRKTGLESYWAVSVWFRQIDTDGIGMDWGVFLLIFLHSSDSFHIRHIQTSREGPASALVCLGISAHRSPCSKVGVASFLIHDVHKIFVQHSSRLTSESGWKIELKKGPMTSLKLIHLISCCQYTSIGWGRTMATSLWFIFRVSKTDMTPAGFPEPFATWVCPMIGFSPQC